MDQTAPDGVDELPVAGLAEPPDELLIDPAESTSLTPTSIPQPRTQIGWLWPAPFGMLLGAVFLAYFVNGPGDPSGYFVGAGFGGGLGFLLAIFWRIATGPDEWSCKSGSQYRA